jgi:hypothetical protein
VKRLSIPIHRGFHGSQGQLLFSPVPRTGSAALRLVLPVLILLALLLPAGGARPALAQSQVLNDLVLNNQAGTVTVRFGLELDNIEPLRRALKDGGVLGLRCRARLSKLRSYLPDSLVAKASILRKLSWDGLTREYVMTQPGQVEPLRSGNLGSLVETGWREIAIDLGAWSLLDRGASYRLDLTVDLDRLDVPLWLRRALFFWSWDVVPEAQYQLEFTY